MCTMLIVIYSKIYEFYSTLIHRAGVVGDFFLVIAEFTFSSNFTAFSSSKFGGFLVLFFAYFDFFSDI